MTGLSDAARPLRARFGDRVEWPTAALIAFVHGSWAMILMCAGALGPLVSALLLAPLVTLHASLQHEILHGHPFPSRRLSELCARLPVGLAIPYGRFRDTHLAHHHDPALTDPYDDPETNYVDPAAWARMGRAERALRRVNNTLAGRMALGPAVALWDFWRADARALMEGQPRLALQWAVHLAGAALVLWAVSLSALPLWAYLGAVYLGQSILKIRTFLEHRAEEAHRERTVVVEDRGPLAFLFLNNNLHALHHARPGLPWYRLPAAYAAEKGAVLRRNGGYAYPSYTAVVANYLWRAKDPVPHPLWHAGNRTAPLPARARARA